MWIAQQIIVENSQLSGSAMALDSRNKASQGEVAWSFLNALTERHEFATFYLMSRLHEQFFVVDNFYLSHKS